MSNAGTIPVRAYLIHITHYDPAWYENKEREEPFDLGIGREVVDAVAQAGFNALIIDLADGIEYKSHPELKRRYSIPISHAVDLASFARAKGLQIVPKLNFSKSDLPRHNDWFRPYNAIEDTDEYWQKAFELVDEIVGAFRPDRFFFIGMDEDTHRTDAQYAAAVKKLRAGLAERGLRAAMWNDTPHLSSSMFQCVRKTLAAEDAVAKDVVQVVWDYGEVRRRAVDRVQEIRDKGFEVWIAPGADPEYVRAWRHVAAEKGCNGMVMTMWRPVHSSTREEMIGRIRALGPLYAGKGGTAGGRAAIAGGMRAAKAPPMDRGKEAPLNEDSVLAPNFLGRPLAKAPYLLPPDVYVRNWMVLGPFPFKAADYKGTQQQDALDDPRFLDGPEADLAAKPEGSKESGATWRRYAPAAGEQFPQVVDLSKMYGGLEYAAAYLVAHVHSPRDVQDWRLYLGSDDYVKVWINGTMIYAYADRCRSVAQDDDVVEGISLRKGWNALLIKCVNIRATWGLMARFADERDRPIVTAAEPPSASALRTG